MNIASNWKQMGGYQPFECLMRNLFLGSSIIFWTIFLVSQWELATVRLKGEGCEHLLHAGTSPAIFQSILRESILQQRL